MNKKRRKQSIIKGWLYLSGVVLIFTPLIIANCIELTGSKQTYSQAIQEKKEIEKELSQQQNVLDSLDSDEALLRYARSRYIFTKDNEKVIEIPSEN